MTEVIEENRCNNKPFILQSKVKQALREIAKKRSPGIDEIPVELI